MKKTIRMTLLALLAMMCGGMTAQTTVSWTVTETSGAVPAISLDDNITLTWSVGNGDTAPKYGTYGRNNTPVVNMGANNVVKVSAAQGATVTKVVFSFKGDNVGISTCDASGKTSTMSSTGISTSYFDDTATWTGEATEIYFGSSGRRYISAVAVTYEGQGEVVEKKADLSILQANILTTVKLNDETTTFWVQYKNEGNAAAENAVLKVFVDGAENNSAAISDGSVAIGGTGYAYISYDKSKITAGQHQVYVAVSADNDNAEGQGTKQSEAVSVNFEAPVVNPTYSVAAADVEVEHDATSYTVAAQVTNTNNVAKDDVKVQLLSGATVMAEATVSVAANATVMVSLVVENGPFEAGEYEMQVVANNQAQKWIKVTVKEAPVVEVKSLEITSIDGIIKLGEESNSLRVSVSNTGNVDIADAPVVLKSGDRILGHGTVSAKAGQSGWVVIAVDKSGLEAGTVSVTAIVTLDAETTVEKTASVNVEAAPVAQASYSVTAEGTTVAYGAESFEIKATVKNTSSVDAKNVTVRLTLNIQDAAEPQVIETLAAGAETEVTFTVNGPFADGTTARYYVQVGDEFMANKAMQEVTVAFEAAPVADVEIAEISPVTATTDDDVVIAATLRNISTVDAKDVKVGIYTYDDLWYRLVGEEQSIQEIAAGAETEVKFSLGKLAAGKYTYYVRITSDDDNADNNIQQVEVTVVEKPELSFTVEASAKVNTTHLDVKVTVANSEKADAENVVVTVCDAQGTKLGEATIAALPAGTEETVTISVEKSYAEAGIMENELQVSVTGVEGSQWVSVSVSDTTTAIKAVRSQYGKDAQVFTVDGKRAVSVQRGNVYIVNGKKVVVK